MAGLIHLYCGDGKGKTSAAVGLAVRASGAGKRVIFTQFFKDGSSSEIESLKRLPGIRTIHAQTVKGFSRRMIPVSTRPVYSTGKAVSRPTMPKALFSRPRLFSSAEWGAWSVAMMSIVPS